MPPCAAIVWLLRGSTLLMTPTLRFPSDAAMAARSPAPPAPTMTTSREWWISS